MKLDLHTQLSVHTAEAASAEGADLFAHEMFEAQAKSTPDAAAILYEGERVTYRELNKRANQLAAHLRLLGVTRNTLCGICVERSIEMIVGVLAILKAGAAYVPLDAAYPRERLVNMFEEARMQVLLTERALVEKLETSKSTGTKLLLLDTDLRATSWNEAESPSIKSAPQDTAYVIFTSGSTGRPKGVAMNHGALANLLRWQRASSRAAGDGRKTIQFASLSFDVSFQEIFSTLCCGGELVLIEDEIRRDVRRLWDLLLAEKVERLFIPPIVLQRLAEMAVRQKSYPTSLREVIVAGEQLRVTPQIKRLFSQLPDCTLQNQYGPTESHVVAAYRLSGDTAAWSELPPIGLAITGAQLHILDEHLQPVEMVAAGELYIGGACLASGYLHRQDLTAERFISNPFRGKGAGGQSECLYRTGDLARRLPDGNLEFLGRIDHQVKIRGYRIETAEVEAALLKHSSVRETVVTAKEDSRGERRLVAYLVGESDARQAPSISEVREFLLTSLPEFMVPSVFVHLSALPLSPNGKVDRAALPAPSDERPELGYTIAQPANVVQARLQKIWEQVLDIRPVGIRDNFFELGGDSLKAVEMLIEINESFGKNLPASTLLNGGTIESLALAIASAASENEWSSLVPFQTRGTRPPLFFVHAIGGEVYGFKALARHLGEDQPFYGIQARGLDGKQQPFRDLAAMATYYVKEVLSVQPREPFFLGGYSLGGTIVFEMAQQLYAEGQREIQVLILDEDAPLTAPRTPRSVLNIAHNFPPWFVEHVARRPESELRESIRRNLVRMSGRFRQKLKGGVVASPETYEAGLAGVIDTKQLTETHRKVSAALYESWVNYKPKVYPGRVILLRTRSQQLFSGLGKDKGWGSLASGGVEVKVVPGNHLDMYEERNASALALEIRAFLERPCAIG